MHKLITALVIAKLGAAQLAATQVTIPGASFHEPQLASSPGLTALVFGSGSDIFVATSTNDGKDFSKPVRIAVAPVVPLHRHRGPRVVISGGVIVVSAVVGQKEAAGPHTHGLPSDGDLLEWRSADRGVTWSKGVRINDVAAAPREGFHALAADGRGNLFAAWLDQRGHGTELFGAWSSDTGATWSKNVKLYASPDGTICQCCHPTASFNETGGLDVMWRNVLGGSRDFYVIHADAARRFGKPEKLGLGTWKIDACPMDGGGLVHAGGKTVTAWRRENAIFLAEPGKPEKRIGEGKDVALTASAGKLYAAWIKDEQLVLWASGRQETIASQAAFPNLTALPRGGALVAWEENNGISLKRVQ